MTVSYALYPALLLGGLLAALVWKASASLILTVLTGVAVAAVLFVLLRKLETVLAKKVLGATDGAREKHMAKKQAKQ